MVKGIDVSSYQETPNWASVEDAGYKFAICKATEGDGVSEGGQDSSFLYNWSELRKRNIQQGAYHFARPDLGNTPESEADGFLNRIIACGGLWVGQGDLLALDMEAAGIQGDILEWTLAWLRHVEGRVGFKPLLYSYPNFMYAHGLHDNAELAQFGLWIAGDNPTVTSGWEFYAIWQSTHLANVPGVGWVDYDEFNGDEAGLHKYGIPDDVVNPTPVPEPKPVPTQKLYTVVEGDSLWSIAANEYGDGSKYQRIYDANVGVIGPDPNLIHPGQVLVIP